MSNPRTELGPAAGTTAIQSGGEVRQGLDGSPPSCCLHELVEAQARRRPEAQAIIAGDRALSFGDLNHRADGLACHLQGLGVTTEDPVALCCERSMDMAVASLAILKAGGTCVPLDPVHPLERLRFIADDAEVRVVVTQRALSHVLRSEERMTVCLDEERDDTGIRRAEPPQSVTTPHNLAYLLYTSGSTGRPKGVALTHQGLANHALAMSRLFELTSHDRVLQFASIAFDLSVEELFPTWHAGGAVILRPPELSVLGNEWLRWLQKAEITIMDLPTGYWERWVRELYVSGQRPPKSLRLLVVGGEQPSPRAYATWLALGGNRMRWLNTYGPTEASVVATWYEPSLRPVDRLPIGRPIENVSTYVLDAHMAPVPAGEVGELYLGGVGLARGYRGRPELTAERFLPDPFSTHPGARLFKTGDLARQRHDGNLEFLARIDQQLKVRGVRVEPGEVEAALLTHPEVDQAAVLGRQDANGELRLVAYCVSRQALPSASELRAHLSTLLPDQLVPSSFVSLEALPLTVNGKLDHDALVAPPKSRPALATPLVVPRTRTEAVLAQVWAEVLDLDEVGVDDNFFDLGGHSLLALQAVFLAQQRLGVEVPTDAVVRAPTVATLARLVDANCTSVQSIVPPPVAVDRRHKIRVPLTLQQEWMWMLEARAEPPGLYNLTVRQRLDGPQNLDALREALRYLAGRHEALRTVFGSNGEHASVVPMGDVELGESDLTALPVELREPELRRRLAEQNRQPFALSSGPLFRAHYYRVSPEGTGELALTCDHLICDGVSQGILLHEFDEAYAAFAEGRHPSLRPLPFQYADFAMWQRRWISEERLERETSYWREKLAGMPLGPGIPFDRQPSRPGGSVGVRRVRVDEQTYRQLARLAHGSASSLFPVCVAAVQALIAQSSGRTDVVVSTMLSGRYRREFEGVVGLFSGVVRLRTDVSADPSFLSLLGRVRTSLLEALEHQNVPFGRVRKALDADRGEAGDADPSARPQNLPVDVQYFPSAWRAWHPGSAVMARHPRHGARQRYFERGQRHPLMVDFFDDRREMWATMSYKTAFYDDATIDRLAANLEALLANIAVRPGDSVARMLPG